jgi:hypothetical protein
MTRTFTNKKSPRVERLALGLFSGWPMGYDHNAPPQNRKLACFDHFFWGAGPGRSGDGRG